MSTTTLETLDLLATGRITVDDAIRIIRASGRILTDTKIFDGIGVVPSAYRIDSILIHENNFDFMNPF